MLGLVQAIQLLFQGWLGGLCGQWHHPARARGWGHRVTRQTPHQVWLGTAVLPFPSSSEVHGRISG